MRKWHCVLALALCMTGCRWDNGLYEAYVHPDYTVSLCPGSCDTNGISRDACLNASGEWVNGVCRLKVDETGRCRSSEQLESAKCIVDNQLVYADNGEPLTRDACLAMEGAEYEDAYCRPTTQARCMAIAGARWVGYDILDLGKGRYIRRGNQQYVCGHYNAIVNYNPDAVDAYQNDIFPCTPEEREKAAKSMNDGICPVPARCGGAIKHETLVDGSEKLSVETAMCNTCSEGMAWCNDSASNEAEDYKCVDLMSRVDHCGACNHVCPSGTYCVNGTCSAIDMDCDTANGELACYCVRLPNHALSCTSERGGNAEFKCVRPTSSEDCGITSCEYYSGETVCKHGRECLVTQKGDETLYRCACVDEQYDNGERCVSKYDPDYCGSHLTDPGKSCDAETQLCDGSTCICTNAMLDCSSPTDEGIQCKKIVDDPENCGKCGNDCNEKYVGTQLEVEETCENSVCKCPINTARCGSDLCEDTLSDNLHCGAQNNCNHENPYHPDYKGEACAKEEICSDGQCVCHVDAGYVVCGSDCIDPKTDLNRCGVDGTCSGGEDCSTLPGTKCDGGVCLCVDNTKTLIRTDKLTGCYNTDWDPACCGSDCEQCPNNYICNQGRCAIEECPMGTINCRGYCLNPIDEHVEYSDPANRVCECAKTEQNEIWCDSDNDPNNGCHAANGNDYTTGSPENCGSCGNKCDEGYTVCKDKQCTCRETEVLCMYDSGPRCLDFNEKHLKACQRDENVADYCMDHWADSDDDPSNGCDIDLMTTTEHCGAKGYNCNETVQHASGIACVAGQCVYTVCIEDESANRYGSCDNEDETHNGCETNISTKDHCGSCTNVCSLKKGTVGCATDRCCGIGEFSNDDNSKFGGNSYVCCPGYTRYYYQYNRDDHKVFIHCNKHSHYGCFNEKEAQNLDSECWAKE